MYKAGIIGCGKIAGLNSNSLDTHAGAIKSNIKINLVACCDIDIDKAEQFANSYQCDSYEEIDQMLSKHKLDIISICTNDSSHYEITKRVLENLNLPKIIFIEKPVCYHLRELSDLIENANNKNVKIIINHSRRFNEIFKNLRKKVFFKEFGEITNININYYGGWFHNATHLIDTLIFLFNEKPYFNEVKGFLSTQYKNDPSINISGFMENTKAKINFYPIDERIYQLFEFDFWFRDARLRIDNFADEIVFFYKDINSAGENFLVKNEEFFLGNNGQEMKNAFTEITEYLDNNKFEDLEIKSIQYAKDTTTSLIQGKLLYNKKYLN